MSDLQDLNPQSPSAAQLDAIEALTKGNASALEQLLADDLRELISNGHLLSQLVPEALRRLMLDPLTHAGLYPGDLCEALKTIPDSYWASHAEQEKAWLTILCRYSTQD